MTSQMHSAMEADRLELHPWSALDARSTFAMWAVMMVGMMVPSAAPMSLLFAQVARKAAAQGRRRRADLRVRLRLRGGVDAVQCRRDGLAVGARARGAALADARRPRARSRRRAAPAAGSTSSRPGRTRASRTAARRRSFFAAHFRPGGAAPSAGAPHGLYCLGCCWILMGLLFFGGVMNLLWVAGAHALRPDREDRAAGRAPRAAAGVAMLVAAAFQLAGSFL